MTSDIQAIADEFARELAAQLRAANTSDPEITRAATRLTASNPFPRPPKPPPLAPYHDEKTLKAKSSGTTGTDTVDTGTTGTGAAVKTGTTGTNTSGSGTGTGDAYAGENGGYSPQAIAEAQAAWEQGVQQQAQSAYDYAISVVTGGGSYSAGDLNTALAGLAAGAALSLGGVGGAALAYLAWKYIPVMLEAFEEVVAAWLQT